MLAGVRVRPRWCVGAACAAMLLAAPIQLVRAQPRAKTVRITSRILGESRVVHVSLPINYATARQRYPVVYLLDGQVRAFFDVTVAAAGYDLRSDAQTSVMPPPIVIGIEHGDRSVDLGRNDSLFTRFLVDELIPLVDREYRTVPFRTLIGHSLGGRFALLTYCRAPNAFRAVVAISPSVSDSTFALVHDCLLQQRSSASVGAKAVRTLTLSAGTLEPRSVVGVERLYGFVRDSLSSNLLVQRVDGTGLGHTDTPLTTIPAAMRFVASDAVWGFAAFEADTLRKHLGHESLVLERAMRQVSARVGYAVTPTFSWASTVTRGWLSRGPADSAVSAAQRVVETFPEEIAGYLLLADAHMMRNDVAAARRSVASALAVADKIEWFDETQRTQQKVYLQSVLVSLK